MKNESNPTTARLTAWETVLQSQLIHPGWTTADHMAFLAQEGYDTDRLGLAGETPTECVTRWITERSVPVTGPKLPEWYDDEHAQRDGYVDRDEAQHDADFNGWSASR